MNSCANEIKYGTLSFYFIYMSRVFAKGREMPKTQKMVLDASLH